MTATTVTIRYSACLSFFFQAEDGIRDLTVTGVQTCALPISDGSKSKEKDERQVEMKRRVGLPVSVCERQEEPGKIEPGQRNGCRGNAQTTESTECSILVAVEKVGSKLKREIEQDDTKKNSLNQTGSQSG